MSQTAGMADPRWVAGQYRNASNLGARIALHQQFSTNRYGWQRWLLDQFDLPEPCRLLELGGGSGDLWIENLGRIPEGWEILVSDLSIGMVGQARQRLGGSQRPFQFGAIDAQSLPFASGRFDAVIANHMLYHVPDRDRALVEIWRVLRPGGRLYASTVGQQHLIELTDLVSRFDPALTFPRELTFTLENGAAQLVGRFANVALRRYSDALVVTESASLVAYILSGRMQVVGGRRDEFARFVEQELATSGGALYVTKDSGLFEAVRDDNLDMEEKR